MLPFDFEYYRPQSLQEAVDLFQSLQRQGKQSMIFSGGTELLTLGRIDLAFTEAVIDIKDIPECNSLQVNEQRLLLGSALSLTKIEEANVFPLLTKISSGIADHTAREKITLGGNICARIFYREIVLPFLLADSQVLLSGPLGERIVSIHDVFQEELRVEPGEMLIQLAMESKYIRAPFYAFKRRQQWETGYPLITIAALKIDQRIRIAISGLCPFPFRSQEIEASINHKGRTIEARIDGALAVLPQPILADVEGSAEYRLFVLHNLLFDVLAALDQVQG
ncbi:FAD binding domain-containing protein [Neobacillus jeddahensis]|uniref:FAD binding domain-containing protein n=1 Tax=Neobacillus jeddahensis TaxID=1461580 RepID=UPI00058C2047|nr:FAD binding domain-containing protein [Neobacillus jeddahensis]